MRDRYQASPDFDFERQKHKHLIDTELAVFLENGGIIQKIPFGVSAFHYEKSQSSIWRKDKKASPEVSE